MSLSSLLSAFAAPVMFKREAAGLTSGPSRPGVPLAPLAAPAPALGSESRSGLLSSGPGPRPRVARRSGPRVPVPAHPRRLGLMPLPRGLSPHRSLYASCPAAVGRPVLRPRRRWVIHWAGPRQASRLSIRSSLRSEAPSPKDWSIGFWKSPVKRPVVYTVSSGGLGPSLGQADQRQNPGARAGVLAEARVTCGVVTARARVLLPGDSLTGRDSSQGGSQAHVL